MKRGRNLSSIDSTTMNRLDAMQVCPLFPNRPSKAMPTVWLRSASSKTMNASLPPSSIVDFFRFLPARDASASPARSDPVRATPFTRGSSIKDPDWSLFKNILVYTPAGTPASLRTRSKANAHWGTPGACLRRTTLPDIRCGPTNRAN